MVCYDCPLRSSDNTCTGRTTFIEKWPNHVSEVPKLQEFLEFYRRWWNQATWTEDCFRHESHSDEINLQAKGTVNYPTIRCIKCKKYPLLLYLRITTLQYNLWISFLQNWNISIFIEFSRDPLRDVKVQEIWQFRAYSPEFIGC